MVEGDSHKVLVADDDAHWMHTLSSHYSNLTFTANLADAMSFIDRRRRWTAAIFDRYLMEGDLPFESGRLVSEAGFILAVAFQQKFPECPICICSGDPDISTLPEHLQSLLRSNNVTYVYKGAANADKQISRFLSGDNVPSNGSSFLDHLLLEPNFCGIGLDLRSIINSIRDYCRRGKRDT